MTFEYNFIVATDNQRGIGKNNTIPWHIPDDLKYFQSITSNQIIIMGSTTYFSIPDKYRPLSHRYNIVLTNNKDHLNLKHEHLNLVFCTWDEHLKILERFRYDPDCPYSKIFICGGAMIYAKYINTLKESFILHLTYIYKNYNCDTFYPFIGEDMKLIQYSEKYYNQKDKTSFRFLLYTSSSSLLSTPLTLFPKSSSLEYKYHKLSQHILDNGTQRIDRTGVGIISTFSKMIRLNISEYVPILTTKRIPFKTCLHELLWFIRGQTDNKLLQTNGVNIWNGNSSREYLDGIGLKHLREGDCGACYGFQWRYFGAKYIDCETDYTGQGVDQLEFVLNQLRNDPFSRRIILNAWNPDDIINKQTCLPPCHMMIQFYVSEKFNVKTNVMERYLSGQMYQRSGDWFLGVPFNILSYTILMHIMAVKCGYIPLELTMVFGDMHIYLNHIEQMKEQNKREYMVKPKLWVNPAIYDKKWEEITTEDFDLIGYYSHPPIKGEMAV